MSRFAVVPARAFEDERLSLGHIQILGILSTFSDRNGWAWPSQSSIARKMGRKGEKGPSRQWVSACLRDLVRWDFVEVTPRFRDDNGGQSSNLYRVIFDFGDPIDPQQPPEVAPRRHQLKAPIKPPPPIEPQTPGGGDDVDEILAAGVWAAELAGRKMTNPAGWRHKVRQRLLREGASAEDLFALAEFRQWRARVEAEKSQVGNIAEQVAAVKAANEEKARLQREDWKRRQKEAA